MSLHKPEGRPPVDSYKNNTSTHSITYCSLNNVEDSQGDSNMSISDKTDYSEDEDSNLEVSSLWKSSSSVNASTGNISVNVLKQRKGKHGHESEAEQEVSQENSIKSEQVTKVILVGCIVSLCGVGWLILQNTVFQQTETNASDIPTCTMPKNFNNLFNHEEQIVIRTAVSEIEQFNKPSVLMLLKDKSSKQTKQDEQIQAILDYTTCKLNHGSDYVELTEKVLNSAEIIADKGKLFAMHQRALEDKNVMLVRNLQNTPGEVAMVFHYFCDEYTAWVNRALYIFTLEYNASDEELRKLSDFNVVEKVLTDKWASKMKRDDLPPLITRITSAIIRL